MGLFEAIKTQAAGLLTGSAGGDETDAEGKGGLTAVVLQVVRGHGLGDLVQKLQAGGLRETVVSWIGHGENLPITAEQLESALGQDTIAKLAGRLGVPPEQASALLSQLLPHAVDKLTPNGTVEEPAPDAADETTVESEPSA